MHTAPHLFRLWFGLEPSVGRRAYFLSGLFLASVKYLGEVALVWVGERRLWTVLEFLNPWAWSERLDLDALWLQLPLLGWMLPFVWIGISMTVRRARDAGAPVGIALLFFVPGLNYLVFLLLCAVPSRPREERPRAVVETERRRARSAATGVVVGVLALVPLVVSAISVPDYGLPLFVASPFVQGMLAAYVYTRQVGAARSRALGIALVSLITAGGLLLLTGIEGAICLLMALPVAAIPAVIGALIGHGLAERNPFIDRSLWLVVALSPLFVALTPPLGAPLREVETVIEIDAPPEVVWDHVTAFSELPPVRGLFFRLGIAHPIRAHYTGHGEDAVRYCEFSTGAFVEPITRWDEPRRLAFDVVEQPPTMEEWSPYRGLSPPHLEGTLRSRRGEFRLVPLPGGRTRLEGSTWYELAMEPQVYWTLWSDGLIHGIHRRVLEHIKRQAEAAS